MTQWKRIIELLNLISSFGKCPFFSVLGKSRTGAMEGALSFLPLVVGQLNDFKCCWILDSGVIMNIFQNYMCTFNSLYESTEISVGCKMLQIAFPLK